MDYSTDDRISFFEKVYAVVSQIPFGRVTSYGAIAAFLGSRQSSRMVGWAMNQSHRSGLNVPAHRVVNRNGRLTGKNHFGQPDLMQKLLEQEGHRIESDTILNFENVFWDPAQWLL
ncbi:MAG: MGMT family protein [Bacteroidales bacterium]|nr:MGMT family protein [Bacteroidales bacterium]